jgi:hypothetical protein
MIRPLAECVAAGMTGLSEGEILKRGHVYIKNSGAKMTKTLLHRVEVAPSNFRPGF